LAVIQFCAHRTPANAPRRESRNIFHPRVVVLRRCWGFAVLILGAKGVTHGDRCLEGGIPFFFRRRAHELMLRADALPRGFIPRVKFFHVTTPPRNSFLGAQSFFLQPAEDTLCFNRCVPTSRFRPPPGSDTRQEDNVPSLCCRLSLALAPPRVHEGRNSGVRNPRTFPYAFFFFSTPSAPRLTEHNKNATPGRLMV